MDNQERYNEFQPDEASSISTLSPIVEMEEINYSDASIITDRDLDDNLHLMSFNEDFLSLPIRDNDRLKMCYSEERNERKMSTPQTPPEELRKRVNNLADQISYITSEYEELKEFTKLEKQVFHLDCIPKEKILHLQNEFSSMNTKVEYLMKVNIDLKNELIEKEKFREEMLAKELVLEKELNDRNKEIKHIKNKLNQIIQEDIEEINRINKTIQSDTKRNIHETLPEHTDEINSEYLFEKLMCNRCILKHNYDIFHSNHIKFDKYKENVSKKLQKLHSCILEYKNENNKLKHEVDSTLKHLNKAILTITSESKNLEGNWIEEKTALENEIAYLKTKVTVDDIQDELIFIANEIENIIDRWDFNDTFSDLFSKFKEDDIFCLDILVNSNTKTIVLNVLDKLLSKLNCYDEFIKQQCSAAQDLPNRVQNFESSSNNLKEEFKILDKEVNQVLSNKVKSLENLFMNQQEPKNCLDDSIIISNSQASVKLTDTNNPDDLVGINDLQTELNCILNQLLSFIDTWHTMESLDFNEYETFLHKVMPITYKLVDKNVLLSVITELKSKTQIIPPITDLNQESVSKLNYSKIPGKENVKDHLYENINTGNKYAEELNVVKHNMIREICSLNNELNYEDLADYSLSDVLAKLMQNIMVIEDDLSSNLQKQYRKELDEINENMNNKLKTQESWVKVLEIENEKMTIELTTLRKEKDDYDSLVKTLSSKLKYSESEITALKNKLLEYNTETDELVNKIDYYKTQKDSLQGKINELNKELTSNKRHIQELTIFNPNKNNEDLQNKLFTDEEKCENSNKKTATKHDFLVNLNHFDNLLIDNEEKEVSFPNLNIMNELESEKARLKNLFKYRLQNVNISEQLSTFSENVPLLKDVILMVSNAIMDIESKYRISIETLQNDFECKNKELNELEASMYTLFNEYSGGDLFAYTNDNSSSSVLNELQFIQAGNKVIMTKSNDVTKICYKAQCLFQSFEERINILKTECKTKSLHIDSLRKIIESEKNEREQLKVEHNNTINSFEKQINGLQSQLSYLDCEFSKLDVEYPLQAKSINAKVNHIVECINQANSTNEIIVKISNNWEYFSAQCHFMASYINDVEQKQRVIEEQNYNLLHELATLKNKIKVFETQNEEAKVLLNQIFTIIPVQITSNNQAIDYLNNLVIENKSLKESTNNCIRENKEAHITIRQLNESIEKLTENNICLQIELSTTKESFLLNKITSEQVFHLKNENKTLLEANTSLKMKLKEHENTAKNEMVISERINKRENEIKLLNQRNNSLEIELSKCQDYIRSLRSEIRSLRLQNNRKECSSTENPSKTTNLEIGVQTDDWELNELENKIARQKEIIVSQGHKITALELKIQNENYPYKIKVSDLEKSLNQAKEKIKLLNIESMLHKSDRNDKKESK